MKRYIALLRGINISGNIIFSSTIDNSKLLSKLGIIVMRRLEKYLDFVKSLDAFFIKNDI